MRKIRTYRQKYIVEGIMNHKEESGETVYEVKWVNYPHSQNTWEPIRHLKGVKYLVEEYNNKRLRRNEGNVQGKIEEIFKMYKNHNHKDSKNKMTSALSPDHHSEGDVMQLPKKRLKKEREENSKSSNQNIGNILNSELNSDESLKEIMREDRLEEVRKIYEELGIMFTPKLDTSSSTFTSAVDYSSHKNTSIDLGASHNHSLITTGPGNQSLITNEKWDKGEILSSEGNKLVKVKEGILGEDSPGKILKGSKGRDGDIMLTILWLPREDGTIPAPSAYSSKSCMDVIPNMLIHFYESKIRMTYPCK